MTKQLRTIKGRIAADSLGLILPHEHHFTDLRGPQAEVTSIHIVVLTGVYRGAYIPAFLRAMREAELTVLWIQELTEGIEGTSIQAGFIKLAVSDDGPTALEIRSLKAAAQASQVTGAVIASHTIGGRIVKQEMHVLDEAGLDLRRFIWVHAQTEPDISILKEAARRGVYVELDVVGALYHPQHELVEMTLALIEAGFLTQNLLSHDAGWYNPLIQTAYLKRLSRLYRARHFAAFVF